tara:strand:- start:459 stop:1151 length:693 start_codon:yes stop_codon:yes gene_type:complete
MSQIFNRQYRKLENSKESGIRTINHAISKRNILDGEIVISKPRNKPLKLSKKVGGELWSVNFSKDNNQYVDTTLSADTLKYTNKFIDYRVFQHNFADDLPSSKIYLPWEMAIEQTALLDEFASFLTPFKMTCHKILFRPPTLDTQATDIVFGIEKIDIGDTTVDSVCTFDATSTWANNINFTISQSDWSASPTVDAGVVVGISIQADNTNIVTSEKIFYVTSVWRVEVVI